MSFKLFDLIIPYYTRFKQTMRTIIVYFATAAITRSAHKTLVD